jgi:hypothetical protein
MIFTKLIINKDKRHLLAACLSLILSSQSHEEVGVLPKDVRFVVGTKRRKREGFLAQAQTWDISLEGWSRWKHQRGRDGLRS